MFENIEGHEENKRFLEKFAAREDHPHALLFYGPEGIGKCLMAKEFARAFLCLSEGGKKPCGKCDSCRLLKFDTGNLAHPDFLYYDPSTDAEQAKKKTKIISMDQIRDLMAQSAFGPVLSKRKVCIINEADTMKDEAANAILKLIEEPGRGWLFILIASSLSRILPTIISRVIQVRFTPLSREEGARALIDLGHDEKKAQLLSSLAEGSVGRALMYEEKDVFSVRDEALAFLQKLPMKAPALYLDGLYSGRGIWDDAESFDLYILMLQSLIRDLLLLGEGRTTGLLNEDKKEELAPLAQRFKGRGLNRALNAASAAHYSLMRHTNAKSVMDALVLAINDGCAL